MLRNTFCHIPRIGAKTERNLWAAGVMSWDCSLPAKGINLARATRESWHQHMQESLGNHASRNPRYFEENLPTNQHWRLYGDFQDSCAFVDIETTGLTAWDEITTAVLYDGRSIRCYVHGDNLGRFPADLQDYALLVTYNGKGFDLPFLERYSGVRLPQAHIDLRYPLWTLGLKGGLKGCERQAGLARPPGLENVDGLVAVLLWKEYRDRKSAKALETLLAYNVQDTLSLHALMVHAHNEKAKDDPVRRQPLPALTYASRAAVSSGRGSLGSGAGIGNVAPANGSVGRVALKRERSFARRD